MRSDDRETMQTLNPETARVLVKRIAKAIEKARYYPAEVMDHQAAAEDVVRPYLRKEMAPELRFLVHPCDECGAKLTAVNFAGAWVCLACYNSG